MDRLHVSTDPIAMLYYAFITNVRWDELVRITTRAADQGHAFAQGLLANWLRDTSGHFTLLSIQHADPDRVGLYHMGRTLRGQNPSKAREYMHQAALLDCSKAMVDCCFLAGLSSYSVAYWICKAALLGRQKNYIGMADGNRPGSSGVYRSQEHRSAVYLIGRANAKLHVKSADYALRFYKKRTKKARASVREWLLFAKSVGMCRDVRTLIGQMVWNERKWPTA